MFRVLWYLVQIVVLVGLTGWILSLGGRFDLLLGDYRVQGDTPLLLVLSLTAILILLGMHRIWLWFVRFPKTWARYRRDTRLSRGHQALVRSLSAFAAGDHDIAQYQAWRAQKLMPEFVEVPTILIATTAGQQGRHKEANDALRQLLSTDARDIGVRGLVQAALRHGDWAAGLKIAREALLQHPKDLMLQRLIYDLECQCGEYDAALTRLRLLERRRVISHTLAAHDRAVMYTEQGRQQLERRDLKAAKRLFRVALSIDPSFVPAATSLAEIHIEQGKVARAVSLILSTFARDAHPDLVALYERLAPEQAARTPAKRMRYFERLLAVNPQSAAAQLMLARAASREGMVAEAHSYLQMAEQVSPSVGVYRALAAYASQQGDIAAAQDYLLKATSAQPDPRWYCRVSGRAYPQWQALAVPDHYFGTIIWGVPVYHGAATSADSLLPAA